MTDAGRDAVGRCRTCFVVEVLLGAKCTAFLHTPRRALRSATACACTVDACGRASTYPGEGGRGVYAKCLVARVAGKLVGHTSQNIPGLAHPPLHKFVPPPPPPPAAATTSTPMVALQQMRARIVRRTSTNFSAHLLTSLGDEPPGAVADGGSGANSCESACVAKSQPLQ